MRIVSSSSVFIAAALGLTLFAGCGAKSDGPPRYRVSGTVTFAGNPVPEGTLIFDPDPQAGNSGPQGSAKIRDGKFDTNIDGVGVIGGPHIVRLTGFKSDATVDSSGESVKPLLFENYKIKVDLGKESSTQTFEVPPSMAYRAPGSAKPVNAGP